MTNEPAALILMYFILPLWLLAGMADWLCHRASHIATTTGAKESLIHILMFAEVGLPLLAALFLKIDALIFAAMIVGFLLHEATTLWDLRYASTARTITPIEQQVHSFLEMIPLTAIICVAVLHWGQFLSLFGAGTEHARFILEWKPEPLPTLYIGSLLGCILLFELLPYFEELLRGLRANDGALIPPKARGAARR